MTNALRRDRSIVVTGLVVVVALGWFYLIDLAASMRPTGAMAAMPQMSAWTLTELGLTFVMWSVMMVAMMIPSASPMIVMVGATMRRRTTAAPAAGVALFVAGYVVVWTAFSVLATGAQWALHSAALLSPMMVGTSPILGGSLLVLAGVFQWTPLKHACLVQCRTPLGFVATRWREGGWGAFRMGLDHGSFCVGCCWVLMALLFVGGVMNLAWVAAIAAFVLLEKVAPQGPWIARIAGTVLVGWGSAMILSRFV